MNSSTSGVYAKHLAQMSKSNKVTLSDQVVNEAGVLIADRGTVLTADIAVRIARHKIKQDIELSITLENSLTPIDIVDHLVTARKHPEVQVLMQKRLFIDEYEREASKLVNYPLVLQKLTVLRFRYPVLYDNAIMGAYLALMLGHELRMDGQQVHAVFIAALVRDVGFLHLDESILQSDLFPNAEEWKALCSHVVIAYQFLKLVPRMPKEVGTAVLEHHERADGLGYPRQMLGRDLSDCGQVVGMADRMIGVFDRYLMRQGYNIQALEPVLQLMSGNYSYRISRAAMRVLDICFEVRHLRLHEHPSDALIESTLDRRALVTAWFKEAQSFYRTYQDVLERSIRIRISAFIQQMQLILISSGLTDEVLLDWLQSADPASLTANELSDLDRFDVLLKETAWQFSYAWKMIIDALSVQTHKLPETETSNYEAYLARLSEDIGKFYLPTNVN